MRTQSVKTLATIFGDNAKEAKKILTMPREELINLPAVQQIRKDSWGPVQGWLLRMTALNALGEFHGVEVIVSSDEREYADYLNAGDVYNATLIRFNGQWRVQTLGDFVEIQERRGIRFI